MNTKHNFGVMGLCAGVTVSASFTLYWIINSPVWYVLLAAIGALVLMIGGGILRGTDLGSALDDKFPLWERIAAYAGVFEGVGSFLVALVLSAAVVVNAFEGQLLFAWANLVGSLAMFLLGTAFSMLWRKWFSKDIDPWFVPISRFVVSLFSQGKRLMGKRSVQQPVARPASAALQEPVAAPAEQPIAEVPVDAPQPAIVEEGPTVPVQVVAAAEPVTLPEVSLREVFEFTETSATAAAVVEEDEWANMVAPV